MSFKKENSSIILIGKRKNELGGSIFYDLHNELGKNVPEPDLVEVKNQIYGVTDCIEKGLVFACHDISEGGIATSLCEMTFGNSIGCSVKIESNLSTEKTLFSETGGFVLETNNENIESIQSIFNQYKLDTYMIGVTGGNKIKLNNAINITVKDAKRSWENGLRNKL